MQPNACKTLHSAGIQPAKGQQWTSDHLDTSDQKTRCIGAKHASIRGLKSRNTPVTPVAVDPTEQAEHTLDVCRMRHHREKHQRDDGQHVAALRQQLPPDVRRLQAAERRVVRRIACEGAERHPLHAVRLASKNNNRTRHIGAPATHLRHTGRFAQQALAGCQAC